MYAAAADEPTLPTRPAGMPSVPVSVKAVATPPKQPTKACVPHPLTVPPPSQQPVKPTQKVAAPPKSAAPVKSAPPARPPAVQQTLRPVDAPKADKSKANESSNLVLRLIAGVQNAGAGVRWGKTKN